MKKSLIIVLSAVIIVILGLHIKTYFEKPIIKTENSLDTNTQGIAPLNQEFWIEKNSTKSLLIVHGLAASPYQTRDLALFLSEKNITIYSIRLTGHGTNIFDLEKSSYNDWYNDVKKAYDLLKSKDKQVYVLGVSVGALLTLNLAEQETPDGIIVIAPSLELKNKLSKFQIS
jgi:carboxylesterase